MFDSPKVVRKNAFRLEEHSCKILLQKNEYKKKLPCLMQQLIVICL